MKAVQDIVRSSIAVAIASFIGASSVIAAEDVERAAAAR
jgi:hypothetical protein